MNPVKLIVLWLSASTCSGQIIRETSDSNHLASLAEFTVQILSSCYDKEVKTVGLAGTSDDALFETLSSKQSRPVVLIGKDTHNDPEDRKSRHKLQLFVVSASSSEQLRQIVRQIKSSHWWNHMATYFILDQHHSSLEHGCSNAFPFLWTAWELDLLNAFYVCLHRTRGRLIYSFNPYTNKAPEPWQLESTYRGRNDHPGSLFQREYDGDEQICDNLEFDKTNDLGGYQIYTTVKNIPPSFLLNLNKTNCNVFGGRSGRFTTAVLHAMKVQAHWIVHDREIPGISDKNGRDIAIDTVDGVSDILLVPRLHLAVQNFTLSYPFLECGLRVMTQHSGNMSQLDKLLAVLDRSSRYSIFLVALITVVFFKFFLRQPLCSAILNVVRIVANSSLTRIPNNQPARIYLTGIFALVVTIVGIYQGILASVLTKSQPLPEVETMQDLVDRSYTLHGHKSYADLFSDSPLKGRFIKHDHFNCTKYVLRDSSTACIMTELDLVEYADEFKLHSSSERVIKTSGVYVIREDWPLEERFNVVTAALAEADVARYVYEEKMHRLQSVAKFNENSKKNRKFRVMVLSDLSFAFVFLAIGLACASVCFVVEVAIYKPR